MAQTGKSTVQCSEDDKAFLTDAAATLDWSLPKLMALAVRGLRIMLADEETSDQRAERMLAKVNPSGTPVRQRSNNSATPVGVSS